MGMGESTPAVTLDVGLLQPCAEVQNAEYRVVLVKVSVILAPVFPFDHMIVPLQPVAARVTLSPVFTFWGLAVNTGAVGVGFTFTVTDTGCDVPKVPWVQVTKYWVVTFGFTTIRIPTPPLFHVKVPPVQPATVNTEESPAQIVVGLAFGTSTFLTSTLSESLSPTQPNAEVQ